jgi:hypothetical protein
MEGTKEGTKEGEGSRNDIKIRAMQRCTKENAIIIEKCMLKCTLQ